MASKWQTRGKCPRLERGGKKKDLNVSLKPGGGGVDQYEEGLGDRRPAPGPARARRLRGVQAGNRRRGGGGEAARGPRKPAARLVSGRHSSTSNRGGIRDLRAPRSGSSEYHTPRRPRRIGPLFSPSLAVVVWARGRSRLGVGWGSGQVGATPSAACEIPGNTSEHPEGHGDGGKGGGGKA